MNFRPRSAAPEPEINLVPFIDVLLVVLIFLMLTTTWSRLTEIQLNLPVADASAAGNKPRQIVLSITAQGQYAINKSPLGTRSVGALVAVLTPLAKPDTLLVISADAAASHQSVVHAMEAARRSGLSKISFAAQSAEAPGS
ncbi:biopolymer transporter ExbD [Limnohabitans sp. G3-2]|uniref:ExbD/TolR family protein n=1 Tax=Limnohabitans sp. G3-2 TaxID=1100711 RepID=UPI000C1EE225|nr:biopolymer transporter ExbD [Limnohabitans sp. G3-2]PIT75084.1 biopolymer transporter ExbD [Limnohabitans sp. G3-2]